MNGPEANLDSVLSHFRAWRCNLRSYIHQFFLIRGPGQILTILAIDPQSGLRLIYEDGSYLVWE